MSESFGWVAANDKTPTPMEPSEWEFEWRTRTHQDGDPPRRGYETALKCWREVIAWRWVSKPKPEHTGSKYLRAIRSPADVYDVLEAFNVTCPARQHAIKKLLCAGLRGKGDATQDLKEARDAVIRAMQLQDLRK